MSLDVETEDLVTVAKNLDEIKSIVAEDLNTICANEPGSCCSLVLSTW